MSRYLPIANLVEQIDKKLKYIRAFSADPEIANHLEYKLYVSALKLIADGSTDHPQTVAQHALKAYEPEDSDWDVS